MNRRLTRSTALVALILYGHLITETKNRPGGYSNGSYKYERISSGNLRHVPETWECRVYALCRQHH